MTTATVALFAVFATWVAVVVEVWLGVAGLAVPSLGLVAVVLAGRRAPPYRVRWVAAAAGCVAGATVEGGLFMVPVIYLVLAYGAGIAGRALVLDSVGRLAILGCAIAVAADGALAVFRVPGRLTMIGHQGWLWAAVGLLLTASGFLLSDFLVSRAPRVRHALERP